MDTEKLKEISKIVKSFDINLNSEHAEAVAKRYLLYKFIEDQVFNAIWCPFALALAYTVYACGFQFVE